MQNYKQILIPALLSLSIAQAHADSGEDWAVRVLPLQHQLDVQQPMSAALWLGTHNSFDNAEDDSFIDYNQPMSLTQQLNKGVRQIGFDLHYAGGDNPLDQAIRLCHNNTNLKPECSSVTGDRKAKYGFADVRQWLEKGHKDQVVLLRLDLMKNAWNNINKVQDVIENQLGDLIYRPADVSYHGDLNGSSGCTAISPSLSKQEVLKKGKNLILLTASRDCKNDGGFNDLVFYQSPYNDDIKSPDEIKDSSKIYRAADGHTRNGILAPESPFEEGKHLKLSTGNVQAWLEQGLNIFELYGYGAKGDAWVKSGNEHPVQPQDMVWSWAQGQPDNRNNQDCAIVGPDGRMADEACGQSHAFACRTANGWSISATAGPFNQGKTLCAQEGGSFAVPHRAAELSALQRLKATRAVDAVWVAYSDQNMEGVWQANATEKPHAYSPKYGNGSAGSAFDDSNEISRDLYADHYRRVTQVLMRDGSRVDQVGLSYSDGRSLAHGGSGGSKRSINLASNEYVANYRICADSQKDISYRIYYLKLITNLGQVIAGGTERGSCASGSFPEGHGLVGFNGRAGGGVDQLGFISRKRD